AVAVGVAAAVWFPCRDVPGYVGVQIVGGRVASSLLYVLASGRDGAYLGNFASNGYGAASPDGYGLLAVILVEVILTAVFLFIIIGTTSTRATVSFAPLAIGLSLTLIHLISIPVSNTSVNPARSIAAAAYRVSEAWVQRWVCFVFPLLGALLAGLLFRLMLDGVREADSAPLEEL